MSEPLERLRSVDLAERTGLTPDRAPVDELLGTGVRFVASGPLESAWYRAVTELGDCIVPLVDGIPVLNEGGVYRGTWLESTATINAELLSRFAPQVAADTQLMLARHLRDDGLMPYKVTEAGPAYNQIQMVTPLARSVWNHYRLHGDRDYLRRMYDAMSRHDAWLARHRDTRGSGGVEAFCAFDTGHDLSPRFWHVPDTTFGRDAARVWPDSAIAPMIAPDLTANVACQRRYLAQIAEELGDDGSDWRVKAAESEAVLWEQCFDDEDGFFYDRAKDGSLVRVQTDVLLRVLACEIGDDAFFDRALQRYLLNTRKFFARYPFTSLALDDPRFDHDFTRNSWGGPSNFLSIIRAAHAFETHDRVTELTWLMMPVVSALSRADRFAQTLSPWSGEPGFTERYSPAILCLLDFVERLSGILPRPDGELWFSGLLPVDLDHSPVADATAYARTVDGVEFELVNDSSGGATIYRDRREHARFPQGVRVITDRAGSVTAIVGLVPRTVSGTLVVDGAEIPFSVEGNERMPVGGGAAASRPGVTLPTFA